MKQWNQSDDIKMSRKFRSLAKPHNKVVMYRISGSCYAKAERILLHCKTKLRINIARYRESLIALACCFISNDT